MSFKARCAKRERRREKAHRKFVQKIRSQPGYFAKNALYLDTVDKAIAERPIVQNIRSLREMILGPQPTTAERWANAQAVARRLAGLSD